MTGMSAAMSKRCVTFCVLALSLVFWFSTADALVIYPSSSVIRIHGLAHPNVSSGGTESLSHPEKETFGAIRYAGLISAHLAGGYAGHRAVTDLWGRSNGRFHFKDEANDFLLYNDEVSHLFISYKLSQGMSWAYREYGLGDEKARFWGHFEAAIVMTLVEVPIDAFNPDQGMGVTDLVADYVGVGLSYLKATDGRYRDFDLKVSVKSTTNQRAEVLGHDAADYDNYIYWLTYRKSPVVFGAGYSTTRSNPSVAEPQLFLGIGTTIPDLLRPVSEKAARILSPLEFYFVNLRVNLL